MRSHGETRRVDHQKPKNTNKHEDDEELRCELCKMCRNGCRISRRIWWIRMFSHINTLPTLLMNYQPRAKVVPSSGKHSVYTHFPKDRNCDICLRTKITRASSRRRTGTVVPRAEHSGDMITADHKVLSEGCESRKKSSIRCSGTRLGNTVDTIIPMKNRNLPGSGKELTKVLGADEETKSHLH